MVDRRARRGEARPDRAGRGGDVPFRSQEHAGTCGLAAVRTVLAAHGVERAERDLAKRTRLAGQGTTPWQLRALLRSEGLNARVRFHAALEDLARVAQRGPVVAGVRAGDLTGRRSGLANHWVVVTRVDRDRHGQPRQVRFHDPGSGADRRLDAAHFDRAWARWSGAYVGLGRPLVTVETDSSVRDKRKR